MKWWAYIHSQDRRIHLKRWFPPAPGELCDLEFAKQEKLQGNDNILDVTPRPIDSTDMNEAYRKAVEIFEKMGYTQDGVQNDPGTSSCNPSLSRFTNLD